MTDTTNAIPEDVMKMARGFAAEAMMSAYAGRLLEPVREAIARAILAERERCAKVAETLRHHPREGAFGDVARITAGVIAEAIKRGDKA